MSTEHAPRSVWPVAGPEGVRLGNNRLSGVGEDFDDQGGSTRVSSVLVVACACLIIGMGKSWLPSPSRWTAWRTCGDVHGVHGSANRGGGGFRGFGLLSADLPAAERD